MLTGFHCASLCTERGITVRRVGRVSRLDLSIVKEACYTRRMKRTLLSFSLFVLANLVLCTLVFLFICDFFGAYRATAVSTDPYDVNETKVVQVHLFDQEDTRFERSWTIKLVKEAELPVNGRPNSKSFNEKGPIVQKNRYALSYKVLLGPDRTVIVPTTTPYALAVVVLLAGLLVFLRNMYISGSPFSIQKRAHKPLKKLAPAGQPARNRRGGRKGPPPKRGRKGQGRRR